MIKPNHIVVTTINYPLVLREYLNNITQHGHVEQTKLWVVGDLKTPADVRKLCDDISQEGLEAVYLGLEEQEYYKNLCPDFYQRLPFNNETRRNLGFLAAYADGCGRLISIDDDNYPTTDDFVGGHLCVGSEVRGNELFTESGFFNVCTLIGFTPARDVYPRGYPFLDRGRANLTYTRPVTENPVIGVNLGLWLAEPDVDATTWLNGRISGTQYLGSGILTLGSDIWTPINTQNTAVIRNLIPAYLCIPMGWDAPGGKIERYGDIWGGYFLQALIKGTNYRIAVGRPIVEHRRNPHNYLDDLRHEYWGMLLTDWLLQLLRNDFIPQEDNMLSRVNELAEFIRNTALIKLPVWCPEEVARFLETTSDNLSAWIKALQVIDAK